MSRIEQALATFCFLSLAGISQQDMQLTNTPSRGLPPPRKYYEVSAYKGDLSVTQEECQFNLTYENPKKLNRIFFISSSYVSNLNSSTSRVKICYVKYCANGKVKNCQNDMAGSKHEEVDQSFQVTGVTIAGNFKGRTKFFQKMTPSQLPKYRVLREEAYSFEELINENGDKTRAVMKLRKAQNNSFLIGFFIVGSDFGAACSLKANTFLLLLVTCIGLYETM